MDVSSTVSPVNVQPTEEPQETVTSPHEPEADGQLLPMQGSETDGAAKGSAPHQSNIVASIESAESTSVVKPFASQHPQVAEHGGPDASTVDLAATSEAGAKPLNRSYALPHSASKGQAHATIPMDHVNGSKSLWDEAYNEVCKSHKGLMGWFEETLCSLQRPVQGATVDNQGQERQRNIQQLAKEKSMILGENRTRFSCWGHDIIIRDRFKTAIDLMLKFKGIVDIAVQANSAAALAWSGGVVILQLVRNTLQHDEDALEGLLKVSRLLVHFKIVEKKFLDDSEKPERVYEKSLYAIRAEIVELYTEIYYYQMRFIRHYSRHKPAQIVRGALGSADWKASLSTIEKKGEEISNKLSRMDIQRLRDVFNLLESDLRSMNEGMGKLLGAETHKCIQELPFVGDATFVLDSNTEGMSARCLKGTQTKVLESIENWYQDNEGGPIFWLSAQVGTGKSTVARTVATALLLGRSLKNSGSDELEQAPQNVFLGATFFFKQGHDNRSSARTLVTTIARCLAGVQPKLRESIAEAAGEMDNIESGLRVQWETLIVRPLREFGKTLHQPMNLVIVIDALDECNFDGENKAKELRQLLQLLSRGGSHSQGNLKLRVLITSRPDRHIEEAFKSLDIKPRIQMGKVALRSMASGKTQPVLDDDITLVLRHELKQIATRHVQEDSQWPGEEMIRKLCEKTQGLYIYAATCCRFLDAPSCRTRLEDILKDSIDAGGRPPQRELDTLYTQVLELSIQAWTEAEKRSFRSVMGPILMLAKPVSVSMLAQLIPQQESRKAFKNSERLRVTLMDLHSVIHVPKDDQTPITLLHLSFRDFLLNEARCINPDLRPDITDLPKDLFQRCIEIMHDNLTGSDLCQVQLPGFVVNRISPTEVRKHISPHTQYACNYWVFHLEELFYSEECGRETAIHATVSGFLKAKYLFWLEALSWTGEIEAAVVMVRKLRNLFQPTKEGNQAPRDAADDGLSAFIDDAYRFFLANRTIIEKAPLQIYATALLFCPRKSIIRNTFSDHIPSWITRYPKVSDNWSRLLFTRMVGVYTWFLKSCPARNEIAVSSEEGSIEIYNVDTGLKKSRLDFPTIKDTFLTHIADVDFSRDGTKLAAVTENGNLCVWDLVTKEPRKPGNLFNIDRTHLCHAFIRVAICPDGQFVAAFSPVEYQAVGWIGNFCMWDCANEKIQAVWLHQFDDFQLPPSPWSNSPYVALSFSPNGKSIALVCLGVRIIDVDKRRVEALDVTGGQVLDSSWSPSSKYLATVDKDTIQIWDISTAKMKLKTSCETVCNLGSGNFWSVRFCADGKGLAVGVRDDEHGQCGEIVFLDAFTLGKLRSLCLGNGPHELLEISPSGNTLVTTLGRWGVAVWDATDLTATVTATAHESNDMNDDIQPADQDANRHMSQMDYCFSQDYLITKREFCSHCDLWNGVGATQIPWPTRQDVTEAGFSPDGNLLFLSDGISVSLWRCRSVLGSFEEVARFTGFRTAMFSADSSMVALGSSYAVEIFSLPSTERDTEMDCVSRITFVRPREFLSFYPWKIRGVIAWRASLGRSRRRGGIMDALCLHNWSNGKVAQLNLFLSVVSSEWVWFSGNGRLVMYRSKDKTWHLREITGSRFPKLQVKVTDGRSDIPHVVSLSDGLAILTLGETGYKIGLWRENTEFYEVLTQFSSRGSIEALGMSPNGAIFYVASRVNSVYAIDSRTGNVMEEVHIESWGGNRLFRWTEQFADWYHHLFTTDWSTKTSTDADGESSTLTSTAPANPCHQLWLNDEWIAQGSENLLWLPEEFRGCNLAAKNDLVALGARNGYVTFLGIDPAQLPVNMRMQPGNHCLLCDTQVESLNPVDEEGGGALDWVDEDVDDGVMMWNDQRDEEWSEGSGEERSGEEVNQENYASEEFEGAGHDVNSSEDDEY